MKVTTKRYDEWHVVIAGQDSGEVLTAFPAFDSPASMERRLPPPLLRALQAAEATTLGRCRRTLHAETARCCAAAAARPVGCLWPRRYQCAVRGQGGDHFFWVQAGTRALRG